MRSIAAKTLRDTILWKRLDGKWKKEADKAAAKFLSANLEVVCDEAASRMKAFPSLHPQYTLHDDVHLIRVTELMGRLLPDDVLKQVLNPVEIALLILAAYMHDQGMVLDADHLAALEKDQRFQVFRANWAVNHPNLKEVRQRALDTRTSATEREQCRRMEHELEGAMLTDYVRTSHGALSRQLVTQRYGGDKRLEISGTNLAPILGNLCLSHTLNGSEINPHNGFRYDENIANFSINTVYLALLLRLADILDFDRERTPDALFRTIHFTSPVSLREWSNHRSVEGWVIKPDLICFTVKCERPEYHRAVLHFMDWIDIELQTAARSLRMFPAHAAQYRLPLPEKVDRERIQPKNNAYIYHDLEFSLSRDEVVKLLMGKELYGSPSLCIRELIQNSLDALRYRKALVKRDEQSDWNDGLVQLSHLVDASGREVLRCTDNGVGMEEDIIKRFLVRAGRSYYRSPEFERERVSLASAGADFDPCSRFGIGFMSCFMIGDQIRIQTRRFGGAKKSPGKSLVVEINGLNGLVVFREGANDQPIGTTVEITGRLKPRFLDKWVDRIRLVEAVEAFVLASEFRVTAECTILEIASSTAIPAGILEPRHSFETENLKKFVRFDQSFGEVDSKMHGSIRTCLLTDDEGRLVLTNDEAGWTPGDDRHGPLLKKTNGEKVSLAASYNTKTCLDGILVCGSQGRSFDERMGVGTSYPNWIGVGDDFFVLDVRGDLKPAITPARGPAGERSMMRKKPTWDRLQQRVDWAHGRLWEQIMNRFPKIDSAKILWQLAAIYSADLSKIKAGTLWELLRVPFGDHGGQISWRHFSDIGHVVAGTTFEEPFGQGADGSQIRGDPDLQQWRDQNNHERFGSILRRAVVGMASVDVLSAQLSFVFRPPVDREAVPHDRFESEIFTLPRVRLPFENTLAKALFVAGPLSLFNEKHPLVVLAWSSRFEEESPELTRFASDLVASLCRREVLKLIVGRTDSEPSDPRALKWLGHMFCSLDWSQIAPEFHPPYILWTADRGFVELSADEIRKWAT